MKKTKTKTVAKTRAKQTPVKEPAIKKHETFELILTKFELLHLRDLMSVLLPPDGSQTVSEALASAEERTLIESFLWDKMSKLCKQAKLPLEGEAPDYIVAPIAAPPMGVFQINQDLVESKKPSSVPLTGFLPDEDDEHEEDSEEEEVG
jgi:hypothetical protein